MKSQEDSSTESEEEESSADGSKDEAGNTVLSKLDVDGDTNLAAKTLPCGQKNGKKIVQK
mgnify:CR=1 FL=1